MRGTTRITEMEKDTIKTRKDQLVRWVEVTIPLRIKWDVRRSNLEQEIQVQLVEVIGKRINPTIFRENLLNSETFGTPVDIMGELSVFMNHSWPDDSSFIGLHGSSQKLGMSRLRKRKRGGESVNKTDKCLNSPPLQYCDGCCCRPSSPAFTGRPAPMTPDRVPGSPTRA